MIRKKWSFREIALGTALLAVVLGLLTFYIWYQTEAYSLGLEIGRLEVEIAALREDIQKLEIRKAALLAPERIDQIARRRLGLKDAEEADIIYDDRNNTR